jgi:DNA-binding GntR family transcriptional regulator
VRAQARIPNRGARARAVTFGETVAITECRMAVEGLCTAKAAEHPAMTSAITGRRPAGGGEATRRHLRSVITARRETEEVP